MAIDYHAVLVICKRALNAVIPTRPGGYAWWYVDAVSDDGTRALAAIFFVGSVFSPDYAARLRRGEAARPQEHAAVNLAVYERGKPTVWVMSEHPERALTIGEDFVRVGDSAIEREPGGGLRLTFRERSAPFLATLARLGARGEGELAVTPLAAVPPPATLSDDGARHVWHPVAPRARVRVRLSRPAIAFEGDGYHDINYGDGRLEDAFHAWSWARFHDGARTTILYALRPRAGAPRALLVDARDGDAPAPARPAALTLGPPRRAGWGLALPSQYTLAPGGAPPLTCAPTALWQVAPFYARYAAALGDGARRVTGLGEHLDLDRFRGPGIQFLLRFKTRARR
jgi:carotenoid 1,2-hydratase